VARPSRPVPNPENHEKVGESIEVANRALYVIARGFNLNRNAFCQVWNRVTRGWRLAQLGVPGTVLHLGLVQDPYCSADKFVSREDWMGAARSYLDKVVPVDVLDQRLQCSERGSLLISAASLPAVPPGSQAPHMGVCTLAVPSSPYN
jgi:hypothetical protein